MAKLSARDGNERVVPVAEIRDKQPAVVKVNPDQAGKAIEEVNICTRGESISYQTA